MKARLWHYLMNSILIATQDSYRAMRVIATYTIDALNIPGNPFLIGLHGTLLPFYTTFITAYNVWVSQLGNQISSTDSFFIELLTLGSDNIKVWDIMIQAVFMKGTTGYEALLPHGRNPFQEGSQEDKMAALAALSLALVGIGSLSAVKTLVDAKLLLLTNLKTAKNTGKSTTKTDSQAVEAARIDLGDELYGTLGDLMSHFRKTPASIIPFFDIAAIRKREQSIWRRVVKLLQTVHVFTRTFIVTDELRLANESIFTLRFAMLPSKTSSMGTVYVDVLPMTGVTVLASALGPLTNHEMFVENLGSGDAKYMIVII